MKERARFGNRVSLGWWPTRTLHPFWGNFRIGGYSPGNPEAWKPGNFLKEISSQGIGDANGLKALVKIVRFACHPRKKMFK
jgi:hypothetical protein